MELGTFASRGPIFVLLVLVIGRFRPSDYEDEHEEEDDRQIVSLISREIYVADRDALAK